MYTIILAQKGDTLLYVKGWNRDTGPIFTQSIYEALKMTTPKLIDFIIAALQQRGYYTIRVTFTP